MRLRTSLRAGLCSLALAAASAGAVVATGGSAQAGSMWIHRLPAHVFAPYFEAYNGDDPAVLAQESGSKYMTLAFIQTAAAGSCAAYWNGDTGTPLTSATYGGSIAAIQAAGGNVIPSFGGYAADSTGTELADSCTDVNAIAKVYEGVITTYHVSRIDLDIEADSLTNTDGTARRNAAVAQVEDWGRDRGLRIQFSYTIPVTTTGMSPAGVAVIQNAASEHADVSVLNAMTFDYYDGAPHEMATDTENAAQGVVNQLKAIYPHTPVQKLWHSIGVTEMPGIDDYGPAETFTQADAATVLNWAQSKGISTLSFWALQRDNGGCPGTKGAGSCSGLTQPDWYFSHTFEAFTH